MALPGEQELMALPDMAFLICKAPSGTAPQQCHSQDSPIRCSLLAIWSRARTVPLRHRLQPEYPDSRGLPINAYVRWGILIGRTDSDSTGAQGCFSDLCRDSVGYGEPFTLIVGPGCPYGAVSGEVSTGEILLHAGVPSIHHGPRSKVELAIARRSDELSEVASELPSCTIGSFTETVVINIIVIFF